MTPAEVIAYITENRRKFFFYARHLCHNKHTAEDLFQDAFESVLKHAHQFREGNDPSGWMMQIILNKFRSLNRRNKFYVDVDEDLTLVLEGPPESGFDKVYLDQVVSILDKKIPKRMELIRAYVSGAEYVEMAQQFGMAEGTVKSQLWRARDQINQLFPGEMQCSSRFKCSV